MSQMSLHNYLSAV